MRDLLTTFFAVIVGILLYRYHRNILAVFERFDRRNRERMAEEERDRGDSLAHYRHTLKLADEHTEAVSEIEIRDPRTATPVTRYVFEGEQYATRAEAERARAETVRAKARAFYTELPVALTSRGDERLH